jgi:chromosome segregation ATPase
MDDRRLALLTLVLVLSGCQSDEPVSEKPTADEPVEEESQEKRSVERARLLNEKFALQRELESLVEKADFDPGERLQEITTTIDQARAEFEELRKNHPRLQKLNGEVSQWQRNLTSATSTDNASAVERARAQLMTLRGEISQVTKSLPELAELEEAIARSQKEAAEIRRSLAEETPEGRELVKRLQALEEKIAALSDAINADR